MPVGPRDGRANPGESVFAILRRLGGLSDGSIVGALLLVEIRQRMGRSVCDVFQSAIIGSVAQESRRYLKGHGMRFVGKPLGRPRKVTEENREERKRLKAQWHKGYLPRRPIEGRFARGKNGYRFNRIRAKRADTSAAWINSIFLVMNPLIRLRIFFARCKKGTAAVVLALWLIGQALLRHRNTRPSVISRFGPVVRDVLT